MSKALRFLQITVEHHDCPFFTVFLTMKTSSQNISITLLQIALKLYEHRGGYGYFPSCFQFSRAVKLCSRPRKSHGNV